MENIFPFILQPRSISETQNIFLPVTVNRSNGGKFLIYQNWIKKKNREKQGIDLLYFFFEEPFSIIIQVEGSPDNLIYLY